MAKWIKVTDKLPKIGELVLVVSDLDNENKRLTVCIDCLEKITIDSNGSIGTFTEGFVTHWQPLPALPEQS